MLEELLEFENTVEDEEGGSWVALVMGEERKDETWIGWIRFTPASGGAPLERRRESADDKRATEQG